MTDSAMQAFPEDLKKEVVYLKKDLDLKHGISTLRAETLELKYERLDLDCKAMEEVIDVCFRKCEKSINKEIFTSTISSIYEEIAVLAKYQRETKMNYLMFEGRLVEQEKRHAMEMRRIEEMLFKQAERHTKEMNSLVARLERYQNDDLSLEKVSIEDSEMAINDSSEDASDSDDDILILTDRAALKQANYQAQVEPNFPIAQSLSELLYETNYPAL